MLYNKKGFSETAKTFIIREPGETRTPNLLIRSQMHYPLCYGSIFVCKDSKEM
jgi:hypothetical protein